MGVDTRGWAAPILDETMDVEYDITLDDALALGYYHNARSRRARRILILFRTLVIFLFAAVMAVALLSPQDAEVSTGDRFVALLPLLIVGVGVVSFFPSIQRWAVKWGVSNAYRQRQRSGLSSSFALSVTPEGLVHRQGETEHMTRWEHVGKFVVQEEHAFCYMDAATALIVPARAFPDEAAWQQFIETTRRHHAEASARKER